MTTNVLVTGAAGFIGARLIEALIEDEKHRVVALDVQHTERTRGFAGHPRVDFRTADLRDRDALDSAMAGCDQVVHLAALRPAAAAANPRAAFQINVVATYDLIELAAQHAVKRIIYGSSHSVYGAFAQRSRYSYREDETPRGRGLVMYGASKLAVEAYLQAHANVGGADYLSLRFGTLYGPRINRDNSLGGMMMDAVDAVRSGRRARVEWAPDALHDLVYVDDAARLLVSSLTVETDEKAVNVVGPSLRTTTLFETLVSLAGGRPSDIDWVGGKVRYQQVSTDLLGAVFPDRQTTDVEEGLRRFVSWHLEQAALGEST